MDNLVKSKVLESNDVSKLIDDFNADDFSVRDTAEIQTFVSVLLKEAKALADKRDETIRSSGASALGDQIDRVNGIVKTLMGILSQRVTASDADDKTVVALSRDEVVEVRDSDGNVTDTSVEEVDDQKTLFFTDVSYSIPPAANYNSAAAENLSEEDFYFNVLNKLVELGLENVISFSKVYLNTLDAAVARQIIDKNYEWHTLLNAVSINKVKLNSTLKLYPEKRAELLTFHYIIDESVVKTKSPSVAYVQGNLFDDVVTEINLLAEGGDINEQE